MNTLTTEQIIQLLNLKLLQKNIQKRIIKASELGLSAEDNMYLVLYGKDSRADWNFIKKTDDDLQAMGSNGKIWLSKDFLIEVMRHD